MITTELSAAKLPGPHGRNPTVREGARDRINRITSYFLIL